MHSPASSTQTRADMAFNSSDILQDLNLTCLSSSSSSSSAQSLQLAPLHTCSSTEPTSNKRTTAMMKILTAKDALVAALREALDAGTPLETLQAHISKSIAQQLIRHDQPATPSPLAHPPAHLPALDNGVLHHPKFYYQYFSRKALARCRDLNDRKNQNEFNLTDSDRLA